MDRTRHPGSVHQIELNTDFYYRHLLQSISKLPLCLTSSIFTTRFKDISIY